MNANAFLRGWVEEAHNTDRKRSLCVELREKDHNGDEVLHLRFPTEEDAAEFMGWKRTNTRQGPELAQEDPPVPDKSTASLQEKAYSKDIPDRPGKWMFRKIGAFSGKLGAMNPVDVSMENGELHFKHPCRAYGHRKVTDVARRQWCGPADLGNPEETKPALKYGSLNPPSKEAIDTLERLNDMIGRAAGIPEAPEGGNRFTGPTKLKPMPGIPPRYPGLWYLRSGGMTDFYNEVDVFYYSFPKHTKRELHFRNARGEPRPVNVHDSQWAGPVYPQEFATGTNSVAFGPEKVATAPESVGGQVAETQDPAAEEQLFPNAPGNWWYRMSEDDDWTMVVVFEDLMGDLGFMVPLDDGLALIKYKLAVNTGLPQWNGRVPDIRIARHNPKPGLVPDVPGQWWVAEVSTQMWSVVDVKWNPKGELQFQSSYSLQMANISTIQPERWGGLSSLNDDDKEAS
jgi:hypothetical protein